MFHECPRSKKKMAVFMNNPRLKSQMTNVKQEVKRYAFTRHRSVDENIDQGL